MSSILEISVALLSHIFGLRSELATVGTTIDTPLEDLSDNHGTASRNTALAATTVLFPEELPRSPSQPPNVQENTTANQESRNSPRSPSRDSFPDLEAAPSSSAVVDNDVPEREHSPETSRPFRSRLLTAGAVLILGVLPLIVLPGVIMGALTGQILMGIALSSAVATVVGVFAGCYYYINRQG